MNLTESAYVLTPDECRCEAERQFAMAEIADDLFAWYYARGGWFLLLRWAELTYIAPYCAKLIGPCPDDCAGFKVSGTDREHGDCWRVKPPRIATCAQGGGLTECDMHEDESR